ncbi:MAG: CRTAC1 family protein [Planctomycetes bacterium]|nr:CRTAC1 family protein [Planctomycetota bacterium]
MKFARGGHRMRGAALLAAALLGACRDDPKPASLPRLAELPAPAALVKGRTLALPAWGDEFRERIDPRRDGWTSEVGALAVEDLLRRTLESFLRGQTSAAECAEALVAPGFAGATELCADQRRIVFDDGTLRVEEPAAGLSPALCEPDKFAERLELWRGAFAGLSFESLDLHVDGVEELPEHVLRTQLSLRVCVRNGPRALQQNLGWSAEWTASAGAAPPRLLRLELRRSQNVLASKPVFREVTRAVFGPLACYPEELLRGAADYHLHQDRLSKQPVLGMHGIAVGDIDGDGLEDIYLGQPGGQPNRLFLRQKDGSLRDASVESGVALLDNTGPVLIADFDGDGHEDLAIGLQGNIVVRWNDGHGHLSEGVVLIAADPAEITSMGAADVDNDGDLDLFACRYVAGGVVGGAPVPYHNAQNGARNLFWRNDGARHFQEALAEVGLDQHAERYGLALYFEDFDEDGWVDLYVVNDFGRNCLYKNDHGHFHDVAPELGLTDQAAGMGADMADVDGDGLLDLYVTNMHSPAGGRIASQPAWMPAHPELRGDYVRHARGNTLLRARGDGTFEDVTESAGVAPAGWAWGSRFLDWSNSGWPDIFVPNGFVSNENHDDLESFFWREVIARSPAAPPVTPEYEHAWEAVRQFAMFEGRSWNGWEREYAYLALGHGRYADVSAATGLDFLDDGRAAVTLDWDDDGRTDLLLRNRSGPRLRLLLGAQETNNHFLELELSSPGKNRDAIGAQVHLDIAGKHYRQSVHISQGFLCASSRRLHFGLGAAQSVDKLEIVWPDGKREAFQSVRTNERYRVLEGSGKLERRERAVSDALAAMPGERVDVQASAQPRVVLYDKMPLQPLTLPSFDGPPQRVADHAGRVLLVVVATWSDPRSRAFLEWLASARASFAAAGCDVRCALLDEGSQTDAARRGIEALGLAAESGFAQQRFRQSLEVCLVEVLGPFPSLPQPLALLFDRGGSLVEVQSAPADGARLLEDARLTAGIDPVKQGTEALLGGDWAQFVSRDFATVSKVFGLLGMNDLAQHFAGVAQARARGR